jgi:hypothetical protein
VAKWGRSARGMGRDSSGLEDQINLRIEAEQLFLVEADEFSGPPRQFRPPARSITSETIGTAPHANRFG